ncbi:MAG: hypothetical protein NUV85_01925 [Candidatus Berkelbacteria bacterium]|nr:hypothetical protein [Candidatus Berkelbacteria bacterium]
MIISVAFSLYIVCQISAVDIPLPDVEMSGTGDLTKKSCDKDARCVGEFQATKFAIDTSSLGLQLEGFDNFFPISAVSRFNLILTIRPEANVLIKVTYPKFSDKVNVVSVFCDGNKIPRFSTKIPNVPVGIVRPIEVGDAISKKFDCKSPSFEVAYEPKQKVEVGPNELVNLVIDGDELVVTLSSVLRADPNWFTRALVFLIVFFISLGAGSILLSYLRQIVVIKKLKSKVSGT